MTPEEFWGYYYRTGKEFADKKICEFAQAYVDYLRVGDSAAPSQPQHVPLREIDGRAINGLKRCVNCGLSETYWNRFPTCEAAPSVQPEPIKHNFENTVQPALNALSLDSLRDLHGKIANRISELECGENFGAESVQPEPTEAERMCVCLKCGAESWRVPSAKLTRCDRGECSGQIVANPRRG